MPSIPFSMFLATRNVIYLPTYKINHVYGDEALSVITALKSQAGRTYSGLSSGHQTYPKTDCTIKEAQGGCTCCGGDAVIQYYCG